MLAGHGDDVLHDVQINFSSNIWYGADNYLLENYLAGRMQVIRRYPEVTAESLQQRIVQYHKVKKNEVLVTSGATEAIYLIAQSFSRSNATIIVPTFAEYEDACEQNRLKLQFLSEYSFHKNCKFGQGLVFLCNPNNPAGTEFSHSLITSLADDNPETIFIIDEAYAGYTLTDNSVLPFIKKHDNLVIIKSLTKPFCIPGLRLGYLIGNESIIRKIRIYKMPWSVNALAIEAGHFIFDHINEYQLSIKEWLDEALWLATEIAKIPGFQTFPGKTPYVLCTSKYDNANQLKKYLLDEHGILIRSASNFRALTIYHFRICAQRREENNKLLEALWSWTTRFSH
jgi:threonine-phosphate decarboxylase